VTFATAVDPTNRKAACKNQKFIAGPEVMGIGKPHGYSSLTSLSPHRATLVPAWLLVWVAHNRKKSAYCILRAAVGMISEAIAQLDPFSRLVVADMLGSLSVRPATGT
jgi:hypothetical protein